MDRREDPPMNAAATAPATTMRRASVDEFTAYRRDGYLIVRGLVPASDIAALTRHTEDLMAGRLPPPEPGEIPIPPPPAHLSAIDRAQHYLRLHMLHRRLRLHEQWLLHPRVLDVLQGLVGPDVLALQSMLFLKPPGAPGQGWHQDTHYIPTLPDTLIGAWIAVDDCDERNGAMWIARGSHVEPVYPPATDNGFGTHGDTILGGLKRQAAQPSEIDDAKNDLAPIAGRYPQELAACRAGDAIFFHGHILHRSKSNVTTDRFRRSFVGHYCNARSFTDWGTAMERSNAHAAPIVDPATGMTNASHILARGDTHLPFAQPTFGTACAALLSPAERRAARAAVIA
jgi:phytanoyl-CoA hydroxylase